jgi:hypothetical protein
MLAGLGAVLIAFKIGYSHGLGGCAAHAEAEAVHQAEIDRNIAELFAAPTGRELVCDQVFDLVEDELHREALDEQSYLDSVGIGDR